MSDIPLDDYQLGASVAHNSEADDQGRFRRFIKTANGVEIVLPDTFDFAQSEHIARLVDEVAQANIGAGRRQAQKEMRDALGVVDREGALRVKW